MANGDLLSEFSPYDIANFRKDFVQLMNKIDVNFVFERLQFIYKNLPTKTEAQLQHNNSFSSKIWSGEKQKQFEDEKQSYLKEIEELKKKVEELKEENITLNQKEIEELKKTKESPQLTQFQVVFSFFNWRRRIICNPTKMGSQKL